MVTIAEPQYVRNQLYLVPLALLQSDPAQPRKYLDPAALDELTASIAQHGVLEPILFREAPDTKLLYIVAGERRCAAARKAGLTEVPGILVDSPNHAEYAVIENILRQGLDPIEEAEAYDALIKGKNYTQADLAKIIGKSVVTVSEAISLTRLPQEIRDECRNDPTVPKKVLVKIARNKQQRSMLTAYHKYREAQAKAAAPATRTKRPPTESLIATLEVTEQKVEALDMNALSASDLTSILETMTTLKNLLEQTIANAPTPPKKKLA